jgi:hypothetical protein
MCAPSSLTIDYYYYYIITTIITIIALQPFVES